jgi:hypothetical protein
VGLGFTAGANLLQGFDPAAVDSIVLQTEGKTVTLLRQGNGFVVVNKDKHPALNKQINSLITSCLDIQTAELVTSDKANFAELGVSEDKPMKVIKFLKQDKSILAGILAGKSATDSSGMYVRLVSNNNVYLSMNVPNLQTEALDYIDRNLTTLKREDILAVRAEGPDGSYTITNEPGRGALLKDIPAGKKAKPNRVEGAIDALNDLSFEDVMKDPGKLKFDRTYVSQLNNSLVYTIQLASKGEKTYIKCSADLGDKSAVVKEAGVESEDALKAKEAKLLARDKAEEFNRRTQGWVYEISDARRFNLAVKAADLMEDEPKKPEETKKPAEPQKPSEAKDVKK